MHVNTVIDSSDYEVVVFSHAGSAFCPGGGSERVIPEKKPAIEFYFIINI